MLSSLDTRQVFFEFEENYFLGVGGGGDELAFRISGYYIQSDNNTCAVFDNFVERFDLWKKFTLWIVNTK